MNSIPDCPWQVLLACLLLTPWLLAGCGDGRPQRVPVSGRVLIDGKPLEYGFLQVFQKGNRSASAQIGTDGRFTLTTFDKNDGCVPGKHRVAVLALKSLSETKTQWFAPKKYANVVTSGLEIDVRGERNDVEIHLTWQGSGHDKPYIEGTEVGVHP
ncbi:MAG: hypothetical protein JXB10_07660 [Pirellulales bacterium]|nr:hypothetical protein [Pirellulales bacterium]